MNKIRFFVPGVPAPGGSKRHVGNGILIDSCKRVGPWRDSVAAAGIVAMKGNAPMEGPLSVSWTFLMPRPKGHYRTGKHAGELKPNAPRYHTSKPDVTKLIRSSEDALTHVCWRDDAAVAEQRASKLYASGSEVPGVSVAITRIE